MSVREMIYESGKLSHTKVWGNIANAAATVAFIKSTCFADVPASADIWFVYLGCVGLSVIASKYLNLKYLGGQSTATGGQS